MLMRRTELKNKKMKSSCCHSKLVHKENENSICLNQECKNYLGHIEFHYGPRYWNNLFALFFFVFIFLFTFEDFSYNKNAITDAEDAMLQLHLNQPLTDENLKDEIKEQNIVCNKEVFAQIQIESGHLNSFLCKRTNNLLGMRYPFKRKTAACGLFLPESDTIILGSQKDLKKYASQNNYAVYACWQDCVKDYKYWQDQNFKITEKYLSFLGAHYAEDADYVKKIKGMMR